MGIRSPFSKLGKTFDKDGCATPLVDHGLGEAYEVVKFVADNIQMILTLGSMADALEAIYANIDNFGNYALVDHNHFGVYAPNLHDHDGVYALADHTHPEGDHDHDEAYQPIGDYAAGDHNHDLTYVHLGDVGIANGIAPLNELGLIPTAHLPGLAISKPTVVESEAEQLALEAEQGDVAIRSDLKQNFIHNGGTSGTIADWTPLETATDLVLSVNGQQGVVVLGKGDVGLGNVDNTSDANKPVSIAQQAALDEKLEDAPSDGSLYARKNGDWESFVPGEGGGGGSGGSPYTLISELAAPTAGAFDFSGISFAGYDEIEVELADIQFSVIGRPGINFYLAGVLTTNQVYFSNDTRAATGTADSNQTNGGSGPTLLDENSSAWWVATTATDAGANYTGRLRILNPASNKHRSFLFEGNGSRGNTGTSLWTRGGGTIRSADALTGLKVVSTDGTISAGRVRIWGIKKGA